MAAPREARNIRNQSQPKRALILTILTASATTTIVVRLIIAIMSRAEDFKGTLVGFGQAGLKEHLSRPHPGRHGKYTPLQAT